MVSIAYGNTCVLAKIRMRKSWRGNEPKKMGNLSTLSVCPSIYLSVCLSLGNAALLVPGVVIKDQGLTGLRNS
jgi:hypothetical protein